MVEQRRRKRKDREKKTFYDTPSLINPSPSIGPKQFESSIHPLTCVSIKTDVFRRDLHSRGLQSTIRATVQKVNFLSTLEPLTVQTFFVCYGVSIEGYT
jgi:hypothetical protein